MGLFDNIKLFKEEQNETPQPSNVQNTQPIAAPVSTISFGGSGITTNTVDQTTSSGDFVEHLNSLLPDGDYKVFVDGLKAVETLPLTEELKFSTVITMKGLNGDNVQHSINNYLSTLEAEKVDFERQLETTNQERVVAKEAEITTLQQQIAEATQKIATLQNEVVTNKTKLSGKKAGFEASYNTVVNKVNDQLNKLKLYVKSTV